MRLLTGKAIWRVLTAVILALTALSLPGQSARAASIAVDTTADSLDAAGGDCSAMTISDLPGADNDISLREAICAANNTSGADTITLPAGTYTLTIAGADEFLNATGSLDIYSDIGGVNNALTINGDGADDTIIQACSGAGCTGIDRVFAVIGNFAVNISDVTIRNGNVLATSVAPIGGGILNVGELHLDGVIISDNAAAESGGGLANDGGIADLFHSAIVNNTAGDNGGGISSDPSSSGTILLNTTVSGNTSEFGGGISEATTTVCFTADTQVLMADGSYKRIADIQPGDRVISFDFVTGQRIVSKVEETFQSDAPGFLRVNELEVTRKHPFAVGQDEWKEAWQLKPGDKVLGDGPTQIESVEYVPGSTPVYNLEVSGVHNFYVSDGEHHYLVHNKLMPQPNGNPVGLFFTTISDNHATAGGGGIFIEDPYSLTAFGSIVAGNTADTAAPDCAGALFSEGYNLIQDDEFCTITEGLNPGTDLIGVDPVLDTLQDNGGTTPTHALLGGSPAINYVPISTGFCGGSGAVDDQRFVTRPQGASCDIGAYEGDTPYATIDQASGQDDPTEDSPINFTAVFSEPVTGFTGSDVSLAGTAGATTAVVTEISPNDGTTYNVAVSGMSGNGTVIATISAGAAQDSDSNDNLASTSTDNTVTYMNTPPVVSTVNTVADTGDGVLAEFENVSVSLTQFVVTFDEDVYDDPTDTTNYADDVTNPANYMLLNDNGDGFFSPTSCAAGAGGNDFAITVDSVSYDNNGGSGPFVATLNINSGLPLANGTYRLYVCGTTSIVDSADNTIALAGDGTNAGTDFVRNFTVGPQQGGGGGGGSQPNLAGVLIPQLGFAPGESLLETAATAQALPGLRLEIPVLGVDSDIVGAELTKGGWDLSWVNRETAYLEGSAYPTWSGNTVLTAHVVDPTNAPGPFAGLKQLQAGDKIYLHAWGQIYVYEVRLNREVMPVNISAVFQHESYSWLTLVTCEDFNVERNSYNYRRLVRAVLISVIPE